MQPPVQPRGKPNNIMLVAIVAIVAVVIVVLAVVLLGGLGGSSATHLVVMDVDDNNCNFAYWTMHGGQVSAGVVVKNTGALAGKGEVRVTVNIGGQYTYTGTEKVPTLLPGEEMTVDVDISVPAVQAAYMGTLYNVVVTAVIL